MKKKILSLLLALVLALVPMAAFATAPNLHTASGWAQEDINRAFALGLIPPHLQGQYNQATTRAEFTAFAVVLFEMVTDMEITGRMVFNDTTDINVQKMGYLGVVSGVGGGNFAPDRGISRQEAAAMLYRLANAIIIANDTWIEGWGSPNDPTFADAYAISGWARRAVTNLQGTGIMTGVSNNMFAPQGDYTRQQSIITMLRLFNIVTADMIADSGADVVSPPVSGVQITSHGRQAAVEFLLQRPALFLSEADGNERVFFLYDLNNDGIPEIFVGYYRYSAMIGGYGIYSIYMYSYRNGAYHRHPFNFASVTSGVLRTLFLDRNGDLIILEPVAGTGSLEFSSERLTFDGISLSLRLDTLLVDYGFHYIRDTFEWVSPSGQRFLWGHNHEIAAYLDWGLAVRLEALEVELTQYITQRLMANR